MEPQSHKQKGMKSPLQEHSTEEAPLSTDVLGLSEQMYATSSRYYKTSDKPILTCPAHCVTKLKIPPIDRVIVIVGIRLSKRFSRDYK